MAEQDPVDQLEQVGKQMASTLLEFAKLQRQKEEQEKNRLLGNQFTSAQNEAMLQGFRDALKDAGISPTDKNVSLVEGQIEELTDVARKEQSIKDSVTEVDKRLEEIDRAQDEILNPKLEGQALEDYKPDTAKLRDLQTEKNGLKAQKGRLNDELTSLGKERETILQRKGPGQLEIEDTTKEDLNLGKKAKGVGEGGLDQQVPEKSGPKIPGPEKTGPKTFISGVGKGSGKSISQPQPEGEERTFRVGSVGESLKKEGYRLGTGPKIGLKQGPGIVRPKH